MSKKSKKVKEVKVVSYTKGSPAQKAVARLLQVTGKGEGRNGRSADYNSARKAAQFGNETGVLTMGHLRVLGCIYNRVMREIGSRSTSWNKIP